MYTDLYLSVTGSKSRPVWGAWIEIDQEITDAGYLTESRPVWGAWIEIATCDPYRYKAASRPVWGAWIEMRATRRSWTPLWRRAPYGARGLKLLIGGAIGIFGRVAPRMGRVD